MKKIKKLMTNFEVNKISDKIYLITKNFSTNDAIYGRDTPGPFTILSKVKTIRGEVHWITDKVPVNINNTCCWVYIPPFQWSREIFSANSKFETLAYIIEKPLPNFKIDKPIIFTTKLDAPQNVQDIRKIIESGTDFIEVPVCSSPNAVALKIKNIIDQNFRTKISMEQIAKMLNTSPAVCSRYFKSSYGLSPYKYKTFLKGTFAINSLFAGHNILDVAADSGFNDLGRFYKFFQRELESTPGKYSIKE